MKTHFKLLIAGLIVLVGLAIPALTQPFRTSVQTVSMVQLIANPDKYDGKRVKVVGYAHSESQGTALYLHNEDQKHRIYQDGMWLGTFRENKGSFRRISDRYCVVEGLFFANAHGQDGLFGAEIRDITSLDAW